MISIILFCYWSRVLTNFTGTLAHSSGTSFLTIVQMSMCNKTKQNKKTTATVPGQDPTVKQSWLFTRVEAAWNWSHVAHTHCGVLAWFEVAGPNRPFKVSAFFSLLALLLIPFGAFTPALEAMNSWSQEEARHDGHHRHWDARENDDEQVC